MSTPAYSRAQVAAAFAARIRRERPTDRDSVSVALDVVDRAGVSVGPLRWPVEVTASVPAGRAGEVADAYIEALVGAVTRALADLPGDWFDVGWHPLPIRVEGAALEIVTSG